jgi:hypothetical protein
MKRSATTILQEHETHVILCQSCQHNFRFALIEFVTTSVRVLRIIARKLTWYVRMRVAIVISVN